MFETKEKKNAQNKNEFYPFRFEEIVSNVRRILFFSARGNKERQQQQKLRTVQKRKKKK